MPPRCTCGAVLPDDARFCHKCGKPQRDEPIVAVEEQPQPVVPPPMPTGVGAPETAVIGLGNATAVRSAMVAGIGAFLLASLLGQLIVPQISVFFEVGAGFFAVYLYRRRTGQRVTMLGGAHLGWISGLFGFMIVVLVLSLLVLAVSNPDLAAEMQKQLRAQPSIASHADEFIDALRRPSQIAAVAAQAFVMLTLLSTLGGAVCAKLLDKRR